TLLLGEYRAAETVEVLVRQIDYLPAGTVEDERKPTQFYYPSVWALCQIGYPAFPLLLEEVAQTSDPERRRLAAWILLRVEGRGHAVARLLETAGQRTDEESQRLHEAAEYLRGYQQTYHHPALQS